MVLPAPGKVSEEKHQPALQLDDASRWWRDLCEREGMGARALKFQALTVTRSGAVRLATWSEFDLKSRIWTVQPGRKLSKIKRGDTAKRVPLTDEMVALLEELPRGNDSDFVFLAPRGGALSDATLGKVQKMIHAADLKRGGRGYFDAATGLPAVPHGLRTAFSTWAKELTMFDSDMVKLARWHKVGNRVQQAYERTDMLERRRGMMEAWSAFLRGEAADNVVAFEARR